MKRKGSEGDNHWLLGSTKDLSQKILSLAQDLIPMSSEFERGMLLIQPRRSTFGVAKY